MKKIVSASDKFSMPAQSLFHTGKTKKRTSDQLVRFLDIQREEKMKKYRSYGSIISSKC